MTPVTRREIRTANFKLLEVMALFSSLRTCIHIVNGKVAIKNSTQFSVSRKSLSIRDRSLVPCNSDGNSEYDQPFRPRNAGVLQAGRSGAAAGVSLRVDDLKVNQLPPPSPSSGRRDGEKAQPCTAFEYSG